MAKRLANSSKQLYSSEASVADSASEYDQDEESAVTGTEPVATTLLHSRIVASKSTRHRYRSKLPPETEKALVSVLLDPVLSREAPAIAYQGREALLGDFGSPLRKAVDNRRRYLSSPKHYSAEKFASLVSSLGLKLAESNTTLPFHPAPAPAIIESNDPLPSSRKMNTPPRFIHSSGGSRGGSRGRSDPRKFTNCCRRVVHDTL